MIHTKTDSKSSFKKSLSIDIPTLSNRCVKDIGIQNMSIFSPNSRRGSFYRYCKANNIITSPKSVPTYKTDFDFTTDSASIKFANGSATRIRLNTEEEIRFDDTGLPTNSYKENLDDRFEQIINTLKSTCVPMSEPIKVETPIDRYYGLKTYE